MEEYILVQWQKVQVIYKSAYGLETIRSTFEIIATNATIDKRVHIISEIQSWGLDNATNLPVFQESSAE